jgi:hypothetical protein
MLLKMFLDLKKSHFETCIYVNLKILDTICSVRWTADSEKYENVKMYWYRIHMCEMVPAITGCFSTSWSCKEVLCLRMCENH